MANFISSAEWKFMKKIPYGHSFWMHTDTGRIAMADDSALDRFNQHRGPEYTDDGVMYLDFSRHLEVSRPYWADFKLIFSIPIVRPTEGNKDYLNSAGFNATWASGGSEEGGWLMETFNWQAAIGSKLYSRKMDTIALAKILKAEEVA